MSFSVTFNESVTNVSSADFRVFTSGSVVTAAPVGVTGSGSDYTVTVSGIHGSGDLRLDLIDDDSIIDGSNAPLGGAGANNGSFQGQSYTVEQTYPSVQSINRGNPAAATAGGPTVAYTVNFSEPVTGVDPTDFTLSLGGDVTAATPVTVTGSGSAYTVTVSGISGGGTLGLNLVDDGTIRDSIDNRLVQANGRASFGNQTRFAAGPGPANVAAADVNGDGKPDLITANYSSDNVGVLLGHGDGTFASQSAFAAGPGPQSVVAADVNGDGKPDLITANYSSDNVGVLLGHGDGTFASQTTFATGTSPAVLAVADVNNDGKPDLVVANSGSDNVGVLLGHGDGTFASQTTFAAGSQPQSVAAADVNGDGKPDLLVGNANSHNVSVLLGGGDGTFATQTAFAAGFAPLSIAIGDFNGDGKLDLVTANYVNNVSLLLGHGDGTFASQTTFAAGSFPFSVAVTDVNGDGKPDVVVANVGNSFVGTVIVLLGRGDGTFASQATFSAGAQTRSVAVADTNGDGKPDLITANFSGNNLSVLLGNGGGNGSFTGQVYTIAPVYPFVASINRATPATATATGTSVSYTVTFDEPVTGVDPTDFNVATSEGLTAMIPVAVTGSDSIYTVTVSGIIGSGALGLNLVDDGTIRNSDGNPLVQANSPAAFGNQATFATGTDPYGMAVADVNGDGKRDLVVANYASNSVGVMLSAGDGTFGSQATYAAGGNPVFVAVVDINRDGKLDVIVANFGTNNVGVLLGHGDGTFASQTTFAAGTNPYSVAVADVNGDGKPDLIITNISSNNVSVLLGGGDGTFASQTTLAVGSNPGGVAVADVNGDGKPDLVVANASSNFLSLLLGNGDGTFAFQNRAAVLGLVFLALADVNNDGKPDLLVVNSGFGVGVMLGAGDGTFASQTTFAAGSQPQSVAAADVNGDGKPDLLVANRGSNDVSVLLGHGDGTFATQTAFAAGSQPQSLVVADTNGDGRPDLVTTNSGGNNLSVRLGGGNGNFTGQVYTIVNPPVISLTVGGGAPNYTTTWYNSGPVPIENMAQAAMSDSGGPANIASMTVTLATFHTGDVLAVPILPGISAITTAYSNGTLILSGSDTVANYQKELRFINYNNTVGGPGTSPVLVTFTANDGTLNSSAVTATINIKVASGQVLGNRLFYNNSKYDNNNTAIGVSDDLAIASDKIAYTSGSLADFSAVSGFNKGITGVMVDLASGIGDHANITAGDLSFKISPITFVTTTFNQLSTWSAAPSIANFSVRMGAGVGGSDRLEITWANLTVTNTWLEVDVKANPATTGLTADDVFYFASVIGNSGVGDTTALSKDDANDFSAMGNNIIGVTTPVWNVMDYTKDGKVDANDGTVNTNNVFTLRYIANPTGPFAPDAGPSAPAAAPAAAPSVEPAPAPTAIAASASSSAAVTSALSLTSSLPTARPPWLSGRLQNIFDSQGVAKILQNSIHASSALIHQAIDQVAEKLYLNDDVLDGLLADLALK